MVVVLVDNLEGAEASVGVDTDVGIDLAGIEADTEVDVKGSSDPVGLGPAKDEGTACNRRDGEVGDTWFAIVGPLRLKRSRTRPNLSPPPLSTAYMPGGPDKHVIGG